MGIINVFVIAIVVSWILLLAMILLRKKVSSRIQKRVVPVLTQFSKVGLIMPLSFEAAAFIPYVTNIVIVINIVLMTIGIFIIGRLLFKDNVKELSFYAALMTLLILYDTLMGTPLMKYNIMSYCPMIGARYYGVGNEYEGITIGCTIFSLAVLLHYRKITRPIAGIIALAVLITSAHPAMGANVGGAISESMAFLVFMLMIYDVKVDLKKFVAVGVIAALVVVVFAVFDITRGEKSHLANFVNQIMLHGPSEIFMTFARKIEMNIKLAQVSVWINVLLAAIAINLILLYKPNKHFKRVRDAYPMLFKGYLATGVGSIITLLVNDSGIIAAATATIYILIPFLIVSIGFVYNDFKGEGHA